MDRKIVCLCGSTRFIDAYHKANLTETIAGNIVLTIGCDMRRDSDLLGELSIDDTGELKKRLDHLHLDKIKLADEVVVLNVNGYIGDSTRREVRFAQDHKKVIRWLEQPYREGHLYRRRLTILNANGERVGVAGPDSAETVLVVTAMSNDVLVISWAGNNDAKQDIPPGGWIERTDGGYYQVAAPAERWIEKSGRGYFSCTEW